MRYEVCNREEKREQRIRLIAIFSVFGHKLQRIYTNQIVLVSSKNTDILC